MSDRAITADLMTRLERHYIKPGQGFKGGVFVPECGTNGMASLRRCDALYVGFTSTSGRLLVGHEVKASRADWLHELDQIDKATVWADQCHEWWLVTAPDVIRDGELPAGWGHMVPGRSRTRLDVKTKARRHHERQPAWDIVRSVIARLDTLQVQGRAEYEADVRKRLDTDYRERHARLRENPPVDPELQGKIHVVEQLERELGVSLTGYGHERVRPADFAQALQIVRARSGLVERWNGLSSTAEDLRRQAHALEDLARGLADIEIQEASA